MRRRQEAVRLLHAKGPDFLSNHLPEGPFRALEDFCSRRDEAIRATAGAATALKEKPPCARCACDSPASSVMNPKLGKSHLAPLHLRLAREQRDEPALPFPSKTPSA
jgi:hypothetical protein